MENVISQMFLRRVSIPVCGRRSLWPIVARPRLPESLPNPLDACVRRSVDVCGIRVHYLECGSGPPIVLIHGNLLHSEDFVASGIVGALASRHRVIAFDRPGFGRTKRPRDTHWTPVRQAALLHAALRKLGIERPVVVGHSLGSLVSVALALAHPGDVRALTVLSGYYYPRMQAVAPLLAVATLPIVGSLLRVTFAPVLGRLLRPAVVKQLFSPAPVARPFAGRSRALSQRPSELRSATEDASYLDASARTLEGRYRELTMPVEVLAGDGDAIVDSRAQSERFASAVSSARYETVRGAGHMVHYTSAERVIEAIANAERRSTFSDSVS